MLDGLQRARQGADDYPALTRFVGEPRREVLCEFRTLSNALPCKVRIVHIPLMCVDVRICLRW